MDSRPAAGVADRWNPFSNHCKLLARLIPILGIRVMTALALMIVKLQGSDSGQATLMQVGDDVALVGIQFGIDSSSDLYRD